MPRVIFHDVNGRHIEADVATGNTAMEGALDNAVSGKKAAPKAEEKAPASDLPMTPAKDQMLAALLKAKAKAAK